MKVKMRRLVDFMKTCIQLVLTLPTLKVGKPTPGNYNIDSSDGLNASRYLQNCANDTAIPMS